MTDKPQAFNKVFKSLSKEDQDKVRKALDNYSSMKIIDPTIDYSSLKIVARADRLIKSMKEKIKKEDELD